MSAADLDMSHGLVAGVWALVAVVAIIGHVALLTWDTRHGEWATVCIRFAGAIVLLVFAVVATIVAVTV